MSLKYFLSKSLLLATFLSSFSFASPRTEPLPESETLKKTPAAEIKKSAAAADIKELENLIFTLERPSSSVWSWQTASEGSAKGLREKVTSAETLLANIKKTDKAWPTADYEKRLKVLAEQVSAAEIAAREKKESKLKDKEEKAKLAEQNKQAELNAKADRIAQQNESSAKENDAVAPKVLEAKPDNGITNATHEKYKGKLAFASKAIDEKTPDTSTFKASFAVDEPIFVRAYLEESVKNAFIYKEGAECKSNIYTPAAVSLKAYLDNAAKPLVLFKEKNYSMDELQVLTTFTPMKKENSALNPGKPLNPTTDFSPGYVWAAEFLPDLVVGKHSLKLELSATCKVGTETKERVLAAGEISLDVTDKNLAAAKKSVPVKLQEVAVPKEVAPMTKALGKAWKDTESIVELRPVSDWAVYSNAFGAVIGRNIAVEVITKLNNENRCIYYALTLAQPLSGLNTFSTDYEWSIDSSYRVPCSFQ